MPKPNNDPMNPAPAPVEVVAPVAPVETPAPVVIFSPVPVVDSLAQQVGETSSAYAARLQAVLKTAREKETQEKLSTGNIGDNIFAQMDGPMLILKIDLSKAGGKSASGKSTIIATTRGGQDLGNGRGKLNLNLYR